MRTIEGKLLGTGLSVAIVVSRFNDLISEKLLEGAKDALLRHDVSHQAMEVFRVPGADDRSEERRVGKECRSRWSPYH